MSAPDLEVIAEAWYRRACAACQIPGPEPLFPAREPILDNEMPGHIQTVLSRASVGLHFVYRQSDGPTTNVAADETELVSDDDFPGETTSQFRNPVRRTRRSRGLHRNIAWHRSRCSLEQLPPYNPGAPPPDYDTGRIPLPPPYMSNYHTIVRDPSSSSIQARSRSADSDRSVEQELVVNPSREQQILQNRELRHARISAAVYDVPARIYVRSRSTSSHQRDGHTT